MRSNGGKNMTVYQNKQFEQKRALYGLNGASRNVSIQQWADKLIAFLYS